MKKLMTSTHVSLKTAVAIATTSDSADKMSTFCTFPFMHMVIHNSGGYGQCCNAIDEIYKSNDGELKISSLFTDPASWDDRIIHGATIQEIFNSEYMQNIRHQLLTSKKPTSCNRCWVLEDNAQNSPRLETFAKNADMIGLPAENDTINDTLIQNPQVRSLDLKFGNECNLTCLMCNAGNSDQWNLLNKECASYLGTEAMQAPGKFFSASPVVFPEYSPVLFEEIKSLVPQLQEIQCTGGEPFISKKFITLLEYIIETGHADHITLEITTNGTKFVTDVMELLAHFRYVRFIVSIDGSGLAYDYVRPPFTYKKLLERCHVLNEYIESGRINATVNIASLCMVYNLFSFPELVADMHNIFSTAAVNIMPFINNTEHLSIKWLPPELLTMALEFYMSNNTIQDGYFASRYRRNMGDGSWLKMLATHSTDNFSNDKRQTYNIELKRYTLLMDKVLNRDYHDFLDPRIADFLDSIDADLADAISIGPHLCK